MYNPGKGICERCWEQMKSLVDVGHHVGLWQSNGKVVGFDNYNNIVKLWQNKNLHVVSIILHVSLPICLAVRGHPSPVASDIQLPMSLHKDSECWGSRVVVLVLPRSARLKQERWFWDVCSALKNNLQKSRLGRGVCGRAVAAMAWSVLKWGKNKMLFAALRLGHLERARVHISGACLRCQTCLRCQQHRKAQHPSLRLLWLCPLQLSDSMLLFVCMAVFGAHKVLSCKANCIWYLQSWSVWVGCPCCLRVCGLSSVWIKKLHTVGKKDHFCKSVYAIVVFHLCFNLLRSKCTNIWMPVQSSLVLHLLALLHEPLLWMLRLSRFYWGAHKWCCVCSGCVCWK